MTQAWSSCCLDSWSYVSVFFDLFEPVLPVSHLSVAEDRVQYLAGAHVELGPAFSCLQILVMVKHDLPGLCQALEQLCYYLGSDRTFFHWVVILCQC